MAKEWAIETKTIQCGWEPKNGEPRVLPIYQSTTYKYDSAKEVAMLFDLEAAGHMYSRISNQHLLEWRSLHRGGCNLWRNGIAFYQHA